MNRRKVFAVVICLVLVVAAVLPGTLAVSIDQASSETQLSVSTELNNAEDTNASEIVDEKQSEQTEEDEEQSQENEEPSVMKYVSETGDEQAEPAYSHIDTCSDDCTDEECKCACHLFNKIMACTTLDDIWAILDAASEDALNSLTDEQNAQIDAKIAALEPAPAPAIVIEESEPPVTSEIEYAMVNYTNVAPSGDPITGQHQ